MICGLLFSTVAFFLVGSVLGQSQCSQISVGFNDSILFKSIKDFLPNETVVLQYGQQFGQFLPESVDQCLGSIDMAKHLHLLKPVLSAPKCSGLIRYATSDANIAKFMAEVSKTAASPMDNIGEFFGGYLKKIPSAELTTFCDHFHVHLLGCLEETLIPSLTKIFTKTSCCSNMAEFAKQKLNSDSMLQFLLTLIKHFGSSLCSTVTAKKDTCLYTALQAYIHTLPTAKKHGLTVAINSIGLLAKSLDLPNDKSTCAALDSIDGTYQSVYDPTKKQQKIGFVKEVLSGCSAPWEKLTSFIAGLPVVANASFMNGTVVVKDLFLTGKFVPTKPLLDGTSFSMVSSFLPSIRLANGYSQHCDFKQKAQVFQANEKVLREQEKAGEATKQPAGSMANRQSAVWTGVVLMLFMMVV